PFLTLRCRRGEKRRAPSSRLSVTPAQTLCAIWRINRSDNAAMQTNFALLASSRSPYCGVECIRSFRPGRCRDAWDHVEERISVAAHSRRGWHCGDDNAAMVVGPVSPGTVLLNCPRDRVRSAARANFSENNRTADFDERLQSSALSPSAWPRGQ